MQMLPDSGQSRSIMKTCAWILLSTAPDPNCLSMAFAATSVARDSPSGARASISLRSGVPWQ